MTLMMNVNGSQYHFSTTTTTTKKKKREPNCFLLFRKYMMIYKEPYEKMTDYSKKVSAIWKQLPESQKDQWKKEYEINRECNKDEEANNLYEHEIDQYNQSINNNSLILLINDLVSLFNEPYSNKTIIMSKVENYIIYYYDQCDQFSEYEYYELLKEVYYHIYISLYNYNSNLGSFEEFMTNFLTI